MELAKQAIVCTLLVHVLVLGTMVVWPVSKGERPSEVFAEVNMVDDVIDQPSQSFEAELKQTLQEKVANLRANAALARAEEAKIEHDRCRH